MKRPGRLYGPNGRDPKRMLAALIFLSAVSLCLGLSLGSVRIPLSGVLPALLRGPKAESVGEPADTWAVIIWTLRFPRVLQAFVEGASLAMAGAAMQGLFRNPMADPFVLGVSSGASLGAVAGIVLGLGAGIGIWGLPVMAFGGAVLVTIVVYSLATHRGRTDTWTLLLSGIAVSSLVSSVIALIMVLARERVDEIVFWTMGALSRSTWRTVAASLLYTLPGALVLRKATRAMDAISFGEQTAFHLGVPVERLKRTLLWAASLITAASVAFTGPIGFIGLIVPHAVRLVVGPGHKWLMALSALTGGNILILADLVARAAVPPREIPVGVITALLGAPFFLRLLSKARRDRQ